MYLLIKKSIFNRALSLGYALSIGIPIMLIGYYKDKIALNKNMNDAVFNDLRLYGLHKFSELVPSGEVKDLLQDFEDIKRSKVIDASGQLSGRVFSHGMVSPLLEKYVKKITPYVVDFFNTDRINVEISYYQESFPQEDLGSIPGGDFHVDDNKGNLKYFIYLSEVGDKNGPFSCIPSTGGWKLRGSVIRGILWELTKNRKYLYGYLIDQTACIEYEEIITGAAGTNFLVDTTSLHRAHPVLEGFRKVVVISFNRYVGF